MVVTRDGVFIHSKHCSIPLPSTVAVILLEGSGEELGKGEEAQNRAEH
jgi:hypothetical protein